MNGLAVFQWSETAVASGGEAGLIMAGTLSSFFGNNDG